MATQRTANPLGRKPVRRFESGPSLYLLGNASVRAPRDVRRYRHLVSEKTRISPQPLRSRIPPGITRSEYRSWLLHRRLSLLLDESSLERWRPVIARNLKRLRAGVQGQPHERNLDRWRGLIERGDVLGLKRVLTGLDRDSIEMREVSPMGGLLPQKERRDALAELA